MFNDRKQHSDHNKKKSAISLSGKNLVASLTYSQTLLTPSYCQILFNDMIRCQAIISNRYSAETDTYILSHIDTFLTKKAFSLILILSEQREHQELMR